MLVSLLCGSYGFGGKLRFRIFETTETFQLADIQNFHTTSCFGLRNYQLRPCYPLSIRPSVVVPGAQADTMSVYSSSKDSRNVSEAFQKAEFYAEDQLIEISPMVRSGIVSLLCGNFGPFEPSITSTVSFTYFRRFNPVIDR